MTVAPRVRQLPAWRCAVESDRDTADVVGRRLGHWASCGAQEVDVCCDGLAGVALDIGAVVSGGGAAGEVRHVCPPAVFVLLVDREVLGHRSSLMPLARRM